MVLAATVIGMLFAYFYRRDFFRIMRNIEKNTRISKISSHKAEYRDTLPDDHTRCPPPQPEPAAASQDLPARPRITARYTPDTGEKPFPTGR